MVAVLSRGAGRRTTCASLVLVLVLLGGAARADGTANSAIAQTLFDEARDLMKDGRYEEACPKLAESNRLDHAAGTLLNLAICHEKQGKLASAWSEYTEVLALAQRENHEGRMATARKGIASTEGRFKRIHLTLGEPWPSELTVDLDGVVLGAAGWRSALPADPGHHALRVSAPGYRTRELDVIVDAAAPDVDVDVPPLERAPITTPERSAAAPSPPDAQPSDWVRRRAAGLAIGGAGVVLLGVGGAFGIVALKEDADSRAGCQSRTGCTVDGVASSKDAVRSAWIADVGLAAGALGTLVGGYLVFFAKPSRVNGAARVAWSGTRWWIEGSF